MGDMSTVRLAVPSAFRVTTIRKIHVVGSPSGTRSRTPMFTSRFKSLKTWSWKWSGTGAGFLREIGVAFGSTWMLIGGPFISGSSWCGHLLKVEDAYCVSSHALILSTLSIEQSNGSLAGLSGGGCLLKQPQSAYGVLSSANSELFWHTWDVSWDELPSFGKSESMIPSWTMPSRDK